MPRAEAKYVLTAEDRTGRAFDSVKTRFATTARTAAKVASGIAAAGVAGFAAMARSAINSADEIGKLSRELGVSTENLSEMRGVIDLVGGSFDAYTNSIRRMQRSITDFSEGSGTAADAFTRLGISLDEVQGVGTERAMMRINEALAGVADETERNALAADIYGRNASTMLRIVGTGADEVARLREEQAALGNTLDEDATAAAERFNDAIARMGQAFQGAVTQAVVENIDDIVAAMESLVQFLPAVIQGIGAVAGFVQGVGNVLGGGAAAVGALATGNFDEARTIAGDVAADVFGIGVEEKQAETNTILREISNKVGPARAG